MIKEAMLYLPLGIAATGARNFGEGRRLKGTTQMAVGIGVVLVSFGLPVSSSLLKSAQCLSLLTSSMGLFSAGFSNLSEKKWKKGAVLLMAGSLTATISDLLFAPGADRIVSILEANKLTGISGAISAVGRRIWTSGDQMIGDCLRKTATSALSFGLDKVAAAAIGARNALSNEKKEIVGEQSLPV